MSLREAPCWRSRPGPCKDACCSGPARKLNEIVVGVLGRAQRLYGVEIMAFAWVSNHCHLLVWVETAKQLTDFMTYLNSNTGREVARLTGWKEKVWGRRYQAIPVSEEEEAQVARLVYILSHGCKENLVACLRDWPGSTASGLSWRARRSRLLVRPESGVRSPHPEGGA